VSEDFGGESLGHLAYCLAMSCPECGGLERRALSYNYFECTSQVARVQRTFAPRPGHMPGPGVPVEAIDRTYYEVCGHQYQEGAAPTGVPTCACGMFAVGACVDCGTPVCGRAACNVSADGKVCCAEHGRTRAAEGRARGLRLLQEQQRKAEDAQAQRREAYETELAKWSLGLDEAIATAKRVTDPIERLLLAARYWMTGLHRAYHPVTQSPLTTRLFHEAFPELWPVLEDVDIDLLIRSEMRPPWDSEAVARWFAKRANTRGVQPEVYRIPGWFAKAKGWHVTSTRIDHSLVLKEGGPARRLKSFITIKGDLEGGPISAIGLNEMTLLLNLEQTGWTVQPIPTPPRDL
jgi:hypothetical protein